MPKSKASKTSLVVIQENRTPDNLFSDKTLRDRGADILDPATTQGPCYNKTTKMDVPVPLITRPLSDCVNPDHTHVAWNTSYNKGGMDGACQNTNFGYSMKCNNFPSCPSGSGQNYCPQYAYVDNSTGTIQPYWDIAEKYGFANYFFQTSQGPSFPAHQFLLSGTSAPTTIHNPDPYYQYFAAENPPTMQDAGCASSLGTTVRLVDPSNVESTSMHPCFEHPTLTDLLDSNGITWRWYSDQANSIWTAPNAIGHICNNDSGNDGCGKGTGSNHDWTNNVATYLERVNRPQFTPPTTLAPFVQDLQNCNFPTTGTVGGVYFVVPDGRWSDHADKNMGLGPDYVANIVNLIGRAATEGGCPSPQPNWNNTVVLITWDDWGGWYDHVNPIATIGQQSFGYPNSGNNNGIQYVYGFRVPLLVVSTFAKQHYISGPKTSPIYYDFGSILKFVENTFLPSNTFINPVYPYADQFVDIPPTRTADLSDFFDCFSGQCHSFQQIPLQYSSQCTAATCGATQCNSNGQCLCDTSCFINYHGSPRDPDDE
jgi:phospholipase C